MFKDIVEKNKSEVIKNGRIKDLIKALDNEEELKKFRPSLEIDQVEDTVYSNNLSDVTDLMDEMLKEMKEHQ